MKFSRLLLACALTAGLSFTSFSFSAQADENLVNEALKAFNHKDYTTANTLIDKHLTANPNDVNAQYAKAMILHRMGHYIKALQRLEIVLKLSPKNHKAADAYAKINQQAVYHLNQGRNEEAIALANHSVEIMPKWEQMEFRTALAGCYFAKGTAYFERWCLSNSPEDSSVAMESWQKTRELDPTSATQQLVNGINAFTSGNYEAAKKYFDEGLTIRSRNQYMQLWRAFANASVGETSKAMDGLETLTPLFSRNPVLHLYKGDIYKVTGDFASARNEYSTALELRPSDHRIAVALRILYLCADQVDEGIAFYRQQIAQNPQDFGARYQLISLLREAGRIDDALEACKAEEAVAGVTPLQAATAHVIQALLYFEKGDAKSAEACVTPEDLNVLNNARSPLALLYSAKAEVQAPLREKACREALVYNGPDALFVQKAAFESLADFEASRNQYARAMEFLYQAWIRTSPISKQCHDLQVRFNEYKEQARHTIKSEIRKLEKSKKKDKEAAIESLGAELNTLEGLSLGEAGTLFLQVQGSSGAAATNLVPTKLTGTLFVGDKAVSSWVNIVPDWQQ